MNIFFIIPKSLNPKQIYKEYPLGVGYIAANLIKSNFNVYIYDQNVEEGTEKDIVSLINIKKPDVIAFSVLTPTYPVAKRIVNEIKREKIKLPVIAGGIHANLFPDDLINDGFDIVIPGEGETTFLSLIRCYSQTGAFMRSKNIKYSQDIQTVDYIDKELSNPRSGENTSDFIERDLYNLRLYPHHTIIASRGCPFKCKFCCNYSQIIKKGCSIRTIESIIEEMKMLKQKYNASKIFFADDVFFLKKDDINIFCRALSKANLNISWIAQLRIDTIDDITAEEMSNAGCVRVYFGIESGSQKLLDESNKNITIEQIKQGVKSAKKAKLRVKTGWIYGLPGSLEEQRKSISLMRDIMPNEISVHQLIPFPGTEYYNYSEKYGIKFKDKKDFSSFCFGGLGDNFSFDYLDKNELNNLLNETKNVLDSLGYTDSDNAKSGEEYVYSLPVSKKTLQIFQ